MEVTLGSLGRYEELPFPAERRPTVDTLRWGRRKHHVPVLLEMDVTEARARIHARAASGGEKLSFTGWLIACLARAVSEHPHMHAVRRGRRRLLVFRDVDVAVIVERAVASGETLPMPYVLRRANEKSVEEIHREIRAAQTSVVAAGSTQIAPSNNGRWTALFSALPTPMRDLVWRRLLSPLTLKRTMGTVAVSSVATTGARTTTWAVPIGVHPLVVALSGIARKPGVIGDDIVIREYLAVSVLFDHDVTDGAPVMRFLERLRELVESAHGLSP